jgi:hypothetical protein
MDIQVGNFSYNFSISNDYLTSCKDTTRHLVIIIHMTADLLRYFALLLY